MAGNYIVQKGDCLSRIAKKFGFAKWQTIYDHADNAAFRKKRPNPNIICAGDKLVIPDRVVRDEDRFHDKTHTFLFKKQKTVLKIVVQDPSGVPLAGKQYKLEIDGEEEPFCGTVGDDGLIKVEIDAAAAEGQLTVFACGGGYTWPLDIGDLDPIEEQSGAISRLQNLAYDIDDEASDDEFEAMLKSFQFEHKIAITGELDDSTQDKLESLHDDSQTEMQA